MAYETSSRPEELLRRYQPRFRRIGGWEADSIHSNESVVGEIYALRVVHVGHEKMKDYYPNPSPKFHLRSSNIEFKFTFDPEEPRCLVGQVTDAGCKVVEDALQERRFFMDLLPPHLPPDRPIFPKSAMYYGDTRLAGAKIRFSVEGEPVPGLDLSTDFDVYDWRFLIPPSPESDAISLALTIEADRHANRWTQAQEREKKLKEIIDSIPA